MPIINKVELCCYFMPDIIELRVNDAPIFRAAANNDTLRIAQRMEFYFRRLGDAQLA